MENTEIIQKARAKAEMWLNDAYDKATRTEVERLLNASDPTELIDSFYNDLEFGTGGLRGIMGVGSNRMNIYTVGAATQGFANYINRLFPGENNSVCIGHDCRHHSREYAETTAAIFSANGITAYLFESLRPTPEMSFAIRELGCKGTVQHIHAGLRFLAGFVLIDGLSEAVDAHPQTGVPGIGEMLFELGVLHQCAGTVAAVADADNDELDTGLLGLLKVDAGLVFGDVDAKGGVLLDAVGIKVIELVVDGADAGDGVGGVLLIIIGLAVHGPPAGVGGARCRCSRCGGGGLVFLLFAEQQVPQPFQEAVLAVKALGGDAAFVQRSGVQRGADLFRRQQDGAVGIGDPGRSDRLAVLRGGGGLGGFRFQRFHRGAQRVFCGQFRSLLHEVGEEGVFVVVLLGRTGHRVGGGSLSGRLRRGLVRHSGGGFFNGGFRRRFGAGSRHLSLRRGHRHSGRGSRGLCRCGLLRSRAGSRRFCCAL